MPQHHRDRGHSEKAFHRGQRFSGILPGYCEDVPGGRGESRLPNHLPRLTYLAFESSDESWISASAHIGSSIFGPEVEQNRISEESLISTGREEYNCP